jgi:hypothetical protein
MDSNYLASARPMSRTYSVLLMHGTAFPADEGNTVYEVLVPDGHTYVVRHVAVTADRDSLVAWRVVIAGPPKVIGPYGVSAPICQGLAAAQYLTSEWSGTHVVPAGYYLQFVTDSITGPADSGSGVVTISGYDLVD